jgi:PST family polysaccharide transporter
MPNLPRRDVRIREFVSFGRNVTGFNIVHFLSRGLDKMLLGKLHGASAVGIYINAQRLIARPVSQIQFPVNTVALPALSSMQGDAAEFGQYYQNMVQLVLFFSMPIVVFLAVLADVVVNVVLGPQWERSIPLFQAIAVGSFIEPIVHTTGPPMVAYGKTKEYLRLGVLNAGALIACIAVGSVWGTMGVACGYASAMYLAFAACMVYGLSHAPVRRGAVLRSIGATSLCSILAGLVICYVRWLIGWDVGILSFLGLLCCGVLAYLLLWVMTPGGVRMLAGYLLYIRRRGSQ